MGGGAAPRADRPGRDPGQPARPARRRRAAVSRHRRLRGHDPAPDRQRAAGAPPLHPARPPGPGQEPASCASSPGCSTSGFPIVAGSEVNDDPFAPISKYARERLAECGDATPIAWLRRDQRYVEKLATPDVTIADIIGDVDPIKAARGGHLLSRRAHHALRPAAARQPRHLRHQRAARSERQGPGRPVQHHAGGRRPDQRLSGAAAARRAARLHRQPRGLHRARQDHHAAQGPDRLGGHHPLPAHRAARHGDHDPGGVDRARVGCRSTSPTSCSRSSSGWRSRRGRTSGWTSARA